MWGLRDRVWYNPIPGRDDLAHEIVHSTALAKIREAVIMNLLPAAIGVKTPVSCRICSEVSFKPIGLGHPNAVV